MEILGIKELKQHIKDCLKGQQRLGLLALVENRDLSLEVESLFKFVSPAGYVGYDWVHGNDELQKLIAQLRKGER